MVSNPQKISVAPPRLISSIIAGFNIVANNIWMVALPVALDLFLWFGPQFRLQKLMTPIIQEATRYLAEFNSSDMAARMNAIGEIWTTSLEHFNLANLLRTIPIGVPSLMATSEAYETPLGSPAIIEIESTVLALGLWVLFLVVGFLLGCAYFNQLARVTADNHPPFKVYEYLSQALQSLLLTIGLLVFLMIISLPAMLFVSIFALINPALANIGMLFILFVILWMLIPLIFTPHGIFSGQRNLIVSLMTSFRLVRSFLPGTGLFLLVTLLLAQGLDILWRVPPANSWLTLVGIFGHVFIYTGLFAASFVYFRGGLRWMLELIQQREARSIQV